MGLLAEYIALPYVGVLTVFFRDYQQLASRNWRARECDPQLESVKLNNSEKHPRSEMSKNDEKSLT
jgi:hypothetical protein